MEIFELPNELPEKPTYTSSIDYYTGTTLENKTEIVDKIYLEGRKLVARFYTRKPDKSNPYNQHLTRE